METLGATRRLGKYGHSIKFQLEIAKLLRISARIDRAAPRGVLPLRPDRGGGPVELRVLSNGYQITLKFWGDYKYLLPCSESFYSAA